MPLLSWFNRDTDLTRTARVPYRLLEPVASLHNGEPDSPNMLIEGDNLDALKALLPYYAGQVKCIYIDPPYNTKSAFEHYDDNLEHSQWLSMMYPRLELLRNLLAPDGSMWVSIDNMEGHYLKILLDEVFGRQRYVTTCIWQQRTTRENRKVFSEDAEYIHVYASDPARFKARRNKLTLTPAVEARYKNPDNDPRGPWQSVSANAQDGHATKDQFYEFRAPSGKVHKLPPGRCWLYTRERMAEEVRKNNIWFGREGGGVPRIKKFLANRTGGLVPETLWLANEVGTNDEAKKEIVRLNLGDEVFDTPKPERLTQRILHIASNPGDLVLDSFLGSGTTAAVAHKMGRRYIGIEMGGHARTHCQPRLKKVVDGEQGGISKAVDWQGGGGFRFYKLGPPVFDENGHIREGIRFEHLAAHVWFAETGTPRSTRGSKSPFLGVHNGVGYYLLYNGILGDDSPAGGNVLTPRVLRSMPKHGGPTVIFGEACSLTDERLRELGIKFRQTPYDIKAR